MAVPAELRKRMCSLPVGETWYGEEVDGLGWHVTCARWSWTDHDRAA